MARANGTAGEPAGLTLLEILFSMTIFSIVVSAAYALLFTGVDTYGMGMTISELERHAARVLDQIVDELSVSGLETTSPKPAPPSSSPSVLFQASAGFSAGTAQWAPARSVTLEYAPDDPNDGVDNNGNGMVDEGVVVLRENVGLGNERRIELTRWVREFLEGELPNGIDDNGNGLIDERGLSFDVSGDVWTVRLTLERRDSKGRVIVKTVETSVKSRN
jgi:prepilin-type N-terminal cleavage/methylation domain-containing protein